MPLHSSNAVGGMYVLSEELIAALSIDLTSFKAGGLFGSSYVIRKAAKRPPLFFATPCLSLFFR